jgi:DNA-binding PadR family transcriptional regulator
MSRPVFAHGRLRLYLLKLLDEAPRHGYEVIRLLEERFHGLYAPSAGTVYPRLAKLEQEGLVEHSVEGGRKVYRITEAGRAELTARSAELAELEAEIHDSVSQLADQIREDVRDSAQVLREEMRAAAKESRRPLRGRLLARRPRLLAARQGGVARRQGAGPRAGPRGQGAGPFRQAGGPRGQGAGTRGPRTGAARGDAHRRADQVARQERRLADGPRRGPLRAHPHAERPGGPVPLDSSGGRRRRGQGRLREDVHARGPAGLDQGRPGRRAAARTERAARPLPRRGPRRCPRRRRHPGQPAARSRGAHRGGQAPEAPLSASTSTAPCSRRMWPGARGSSPFSLH